MDAFPYDDAGTDRGYRLPDGSLGFMREEVDPLKDPRRAKLEVMLLQRALGVPVDVVFRDEEIIQDEVINFVDSYRRLPWVRMVWFTVPLASSKYMLGVVHSYTQWDPARGPDRWVRPKPAWGVNLEPGDTRVFDQWNMDAYTATRYRGKIAFLTGIRASESLIRFRASVNKLNENYINAVSDPTARHVNLCKPIFDWEENDVFRYFYDRKIQYCPLYDHQMWAGKPQLRVATPFIAESSKQFGLVRSTSPKFYENIIRCFPEMLAHERYFKDLDRDALQAKYGQSHAGVRAWIEENIEDEKWYALAVKRFDSAMGREAENPGGYPPDYLLSAFMAGTYKRELLPKGKK